MFAALQFVVGEGKNKEYTYYYGEYEAVKAKRDERVKELRNPFTESCVLREFREAEKLQKFLDIKTKIEEFRFICLTGKSLDKFV